MIKITKLFFSFFLTTVHCSYNESERTLKRMLLCVHVFQFALLKDKCPYGSLIQFVSFTAKAFTNLHSFTVCKQNSSNGIIAWLSFIGSFWGTGLCIYKRINRGSYTSDHLL